MIKIIELNFGEEEEKAILEILHSKHITRGPWTNKFQESFNSYIGSKKTYTVCSGTAALFISLLALDVKEKYVAVPALSFMATIDMVYRAGGVPIVIDVDENYTMDTEKLEEALKKYDIKVVIPVHLYGKMADMKSIMSLSNKYGFYVLEDSAQAHGASLENKKAGSIGHIGAFSFYASKNVPMGEGGAITINDESLIKKVSSLIEFGESPAFNFRITEFQAAIGYIQLQKLESFNKKRKENAAFYNKNLKDDYIKPKRDSEEEHVFHLYTLRHKNRDKILEKLKEKGIEGRIYYDYTLASLRKAKSLNLEKAEKFTKELFSIPVHQYLKEEELGLIVETLNNI